MGATEADCHAVQLRIVGIGDRTDRSDRHRRAGPRGRVARAGACTIQIYDRRDIGDTRQSDVVAGAPGIADLELHGRQRDKGTFRQTGERADDRARTGVIDDPKYLADGWGKAETERTVQRSAS